MIDIHMHTSYSDGTDSVIELLKKAEEKKLEYISITDHNTCKAYKELENIDIKKYYNGKIIRGVELNTKIDGINIELLGYGIETDRIEDKLEKLYENFRNKNDIELKELYRICKEKKVKLDEGILDKYQPKKYAYASLYIHEEIRKYPENRSLFLSQESWNDVMVFYRKEMCNKNSNFYIDSTNLVPDMQTVINLIKSLNGLVFVPHIYVYGDNSEYIFENIINNYKIDGFECFYSKFSKKQNETIYNYFKENNLYISGGSDYHGETKPNVKMGSGINNNLKMPKDIIMPWVKEEYILK